MKQLKIKLILNMVLLQLKLSKENITYAKILKATDQIKDISKFIDNLITEHRNTQNTNE